MVEDSPIGKLINQLSSCLSTIRTNLEWYKLREQEKRRCDPPLLADDLELNASLREGQSQFLSLATQLHNLLNEGDTDKKSVADFEMSRQKTLGLEREFHGLAIPKHL